MLVNTFRRSKISFFPRIHNEMTSPFLSALINNEYNFFQLVKLMVESLEEAKQLTAESLYHYRSVDKTRKMV